MEVSLKYVCEFRTSYCVSCRAISEKSICRISLQGSKSLACRVEYTSSARHFLSALSGCMMHGRGWPRNLRRKCCIGFNRFNHLAALLVSLRSPRAPPCTAPCSKSAGMAAASGSGSGPGRCSTSATGRTAPWRTRSSPPVATAALMKSELSPNGKEEIRNI